MSQPVKLPNANQIATERVKDMPVSTVTERITKAARHMIEVQRAKDELARGEWKL